METNTLLLLGLIAVAAIRFLYVVISEEMARGPRQEYREEDF